MAKPDYRRHRHIKEISEESKFWDVDYLIRNLEEEMDRVEHGMSHLVWGPEDRLVTHRMRPMPIIPEHETFTSENEFRVKVNLPNVPRGNIKVNIDRDSVEVLACSDDMVCKPYHIHIGADGVLDPDSAQAHMSETVLEITVRKIKKRRVEVR
jgi:HSP20 family molecular chaperone IbpA